MGKRYDQLDLDDRIEIFRLHAAGKSRHEIGHLMGRDASMISRELRRNSLPRGEYKPASADRIALSRRRRLSKIERLSRLRDLGIGAIRSAVGGPANFLELGSSEELSRKLMIEQSSGIAVLRYLSQKISASRIPIPAPQEFAGISLKEGNDPIEVG